MRKGFFSIFKAEVIQIITNFRLLFLIIVVPIGLFIYYATLMNEGVPKKLPIVLYDQDNTQTSRKLVRMLNASSTLDIVKEVDNYKEGEKQVKIAESFGLVVIPYQFEKKLYKGDPVQVIGFYNAQYILAGSLINQAFQKVVGTFAAGVNAQNLTKKGQTPYQALANTSPVNIDEHILFNPYTSYAYYLTIALMPMAFQVVIFVITVYALGSVLKYNKGKELLAASGDNVWIAFLGKVLPYTIIFSIIGFFMNSFLYYKIGVPLKGNFWVVNLFFLIFVLVCQLMALFVVSITSDLRTALTIGGGYAALSFSFAGYTFPTDGMPVVIQYFGYIFPFTSYLKMTIDYAIRGIHFNSMESKYFIALGIFSTIGLVSIFRYYKLLKKGRYNAK